MKRVRCLFGTLVIGLWVAPLAAQSPGTVRGRVTDGATREPLTGVTVSIGSRGAITQADGRYLITGVPAGSDTLRARIVGYAPAVQTVTVAGGDTVVVDLAMNAQAVGLAEMVVIGYGEQAAGNITGAASQVTSDEFNPGRIVSPAQLIQSKVAGVQVVDNNEPGGGLSLRIRGGTSVNASNEPLYVVDGMPVGNYSGGGVSAGRDPLNSLNPDDLASITVLRDASAAAIYGANAANGVIIIQTKSGSRPLVEYTGSTSASQITRTPHMLNATQFAAAVNQYYPALATQLGTANTDWFSMVDRTAFGQDHNLAVSGSDANTNWRVSGGYLNQDGIIDGTTIDRLSLGLNLRQRLLTDRLDVRANLKGSREHDLFTPGGVLSNAAQMGPTQPVFDSSSATGYYEWQSAGGRQPDNPVAILGLATDEGTTYRSIGNVQAAYRLPWLGEALRATVNLGYDVTGVDRGNFNPSVLHSEAKSGHDGTDYRYSNNQLNTTLETYLNYAAPLRAMPGTIDLTGGYSWSQSHGDFSSYLGEGLSTDVLGGNAVTTARTVTNIRDIQESRLISFFGRATYNLNDRYLAAVSLRRDGSSRFGPTHQWGTFPSVSVGWRISEEPFMPRFASLSDMKVRASWARTGNQSIANYVQYAAYLAGTSSAQQLFGNSFVSTIRPGAYNPDIHWEATRAWNVGLDYGFANQRFSGAVDWYTKNTSDLVFYVPVAAGTNLTNFVTKNIGSMRNRGIELSFNARMLEARGHGLSWTASFTVSHNSNELTSINPVFGTAQILVGGIAGGVGNTVEMLQAGLPVNTFRVFQQRYDSTTGKPIEGSYVDQPTVLDSAACGGATPAAGCVGLYRPDGIINDADKRPFHDPNPKWILGHTSYFHFGNLDFNFTLRAYLGSYVYNNVASNFGTYQELNRDSPYNLHASVLETNFAAPQYWSDYYVENASFLRMDNLQAAYSFSYHGQPMRAFAAVQNAFTITGYSGVDPTSGLNGIDNNIYPRSRTFSAGLTVRF